MLDRFLPAGCATVPFRGAFDLVLGFDLPQAFVDDVGAAFQQAPDCTPSGDIIGTHLSRLSQGVTHRDGCRRGDHDEPNESAGRWTSKRPSIFVFHRSPSLGP